MKALKWIFIALASLAVLVLLFYAEEDWRGKRAWENCKRELEAKGETLDWDKFIPPSVPDDQNFFKAQKMEEWFVGRGDTDLSTRLKNEKTYWFGKDSKIKSEADAKDYLAWSDQFGPDFDLIREALKRPYARMDGNYYHDWGDNPVPNFLTVRIVVQTLAQRAHCYLMLGQPDKALQELTFMHDMCRLLEGAPTGKPMTLVAAMINVAVNGLYTEIIVEGFQKNAWQEWQLISLQAQLKEINLLPFLVQANRSERAGTLQITEMMEKEPSDRISDLFCTHGLSGNKITFHILLLRLKYMLLPDEHIPRGWYYQNMVTIAKLNQDEIDCVNLTNNLISAKKADVVHRKIAVLDKRYNMFMADFSKAWQTTAHNQTMVNEAQIACALERYHLAHGEYPETLDVLAPQFIQKIPNDIIADPPSQGFGATSQPLVYRPTLGGKFLLYSIGWNEKDDGGMDLPEIKNSASPFAQGDWVWKN